MIERYQHNHYKQKFLNNKNLFSKLRYLQGFSEYSALKNVNIKETFQSFYHTLYKKNKDKLQAKTKIKLDQFKELEKNIQIKK